MIITEDKVRHINKKYSDGHTINESLSFAADIKSNLMFGNIPHLLRALLVDHTFVDGNKRTASYLIILFCKEYNLEYNKERIIRTIIKITKTRPTKIVNIRRLIKHAIGTNH